MNKIIQLVFKVELLNTSWCTIAKIPKEAKDHPYIENHICTYKPATSPCKACGKFDTHHSHKRTEGKNIIPDAQFGFL